MRGKRLSIGLRAVAIFAVTLFATSTWAANETVLYTFNPRYTDGAFPYSSLIMDGAGNLYGTTYQGGTNFYGTVFELTPNAGGGWTEKVLYNFNGTDGAYPYAGLVMDAAGNLYGRTLFGGTYTAGTVFELTPHADGTWTEKVLHHFNGSDGSHPYGSLIFDTHGNLYGTTNHGGKRNSGTVFELTPQADGSWTETVLHSFGKDKDGVSPEASLIFDTDGNLYGTTRYGGTYDSCDSGCGTVFELTPQADGSWTEKVLHNFHHGMGAGLFPGPA